MPDVKHDDFTGMTFDEIAAKYGEDAAINAGIAADPDAPEADAAWFDRARPAAGVDPDFVERVRRGAANRRRPPRNRSRCAWIRTSRHTSAPAGAAGRHA